MKKSKRALSFLTAAVMLCGVALPAEPLAQLGAVLTVRAEEESMPTSGKCGNNLTWEYDDSTKTLTFSGRGKMWDYDAYDETVVPPWTWYASDIEYANIEDGVTSIGSYAFYCCHSLTSVTIPNGVTSIGDSAFHACSSLISVTIPSSAKSIDRDAFEGTPWLEAKFKENPLLICNNILVVADPDFEGECIIPDGVTSIGEEAFYNCSLISVMIPNSVKSIGEGAFSNCEFLTSVTIPKSVTSIGDRTFSGCESMEFVTIPKGVTSIGDNAFSGCASMTSIEIPNSVTSIGDYAFSYCDYLRSVTIPNGVTSIGSGAFMMCDLLNVVKIPDSVTSIGDSAFAFCDYLFSVTIPDDLIVMSLSNWAFAGTPWLEAKFAENPLLIYDNILVAVDRDFEGECIIPDGITGIGNRAFEYCSLTSVTIPDSVTSIGDSAFYGCGALISAVIPDSVTSIGNSAFYDCSSLKSLTIPHSVTSIGDSAFYRCSDLTSVEILGSGVSIGDEAFRECWSLTSVTIPDSVKRIGKSVFYETPWLEEKLKENPLWIHSGILAEVDSDFEGECIIPDGVTRINDYAFAWISLTSVTIPKSVTSIGDHAFYRCGIRPTIIIENPDCEIYDDPFTIHDTNDLTYTVTIYGYENSTAQAYAEKYGQTFKSLGAAPGTDTTEPDDTEPDPTDPAPAPTYGDVDGNGGISISDVVALNKYLLGDETAISESGRANADVDANGTLDSLDSLNILKCCVMLLNEEDFPLA